MTSLTLNLMQLLCLTLVSYIVTLSLAAAAIFHIPRMWIVKVSPWLITPGYAHPVVCRMCLGFWVSGVTTFLFSGSFHLFDALAVYGLSYFFASQERRS